MAGRPPLFNEDDIPMLQERLDAYLKEPVCTISGLILALGFRRKKTYYETKDKDTEVAAFLQYAHLHMERYYEERAQLAKNPGGAIFVLKNMGWSDKGTEDPGSKENPLHMVVTGMQIT